MSSVSNVNSVQFNSNELMQKVVGKVHRRYQTLDIISKQPPIPVGLLERIQDAVMDFLVGFTKEGKAQKEMRDGLKGMAIQINTGAMDGVAATVKAFSARVKALDSSLDEPQIASLFKATMVALSTARRNPVEALAADKVEQVTKEINSALGIKEATVTSSTSSFPYKKAAVAVAGLAVLGLAAYFGISALLARGIKNPLPTNDSGVCFANQTRPVENGFCPAVLKEVVKNLFPALEKATYPNQKLCFLDDAPRN